MSFITRGQQLQLMRELRGGQFFRNLFGSIRRGFATLKGLRRRFQRTKPLSGTLRKLNDFIPPRFGTVKDIVSKAQRISELAGFGKPMTAAEKKKASKFVLSKAMQKELMKSKFIDQQARGFFGSLFRGLKRIGRVIATPIRAVARVIKPVTRVIGNVAKIGEKIPFVGSVAKRIGSAANTLHGIASAVGGQKGGVIRLAVIPARQKVRVLPVPIKKRKKTVKAKGLKGGRGKLRGSAGMKGGRRNRKPKSTKFVKF